MIGVLVALQLAAAPPPPVMTVRGHGPDRTVPIVITGSGPAVRIDLVAPTIPLVVNNLPNHRYRVTFAGFEVEVTEHVPFARLGSRLLPLARAPFTDAGRLYLPLQLVDAVAREPRSPVQYDASRRELRLLVSGSVAGTGRPTAPAAAPAANDDERNARRRRVVVDAGHGGPDNGMTGPLGGRAKIHEKDITLAVSKRLASALRSKGVDVVMTRTTDTLIALSDRGRIANQQQGDLFISVHVNAANMNWRQPADARGFETYFLAEARTEDAKRVERMENEAVRFETGVNAPKADPLSFIIADMAQNEHLRESAELAAIVQQHLQRMHPGPNRGVKQAGFRVLVTAFMPAVLVEIGFGTNAEEARFLADPDRQQRIAGAVADAAMEYLHNYERRVGTAP